MFEFDAGKLVIIGIVALIVVGPKELPRVLRQAGQAMAKLRSMAAEFQGQFMEAMREAELADIKEEAAKLAASAKIDAGLNPVAELRSELTRAIDGAGVTAASTAADEPKQTEGPLARDRAPNPILEPGDFEALGETGVSLPVLVPEAGQDEPATEGSGQRQTPEPTHASLAGNS